ncbi:outer membrane protein assembly factor BamB family protein [Streptomyces kaniharaensis]
MRTGDWGVWADEERAYTTWDGSDLQAVKLADGTQLWSTKHQGDRFGAPLVAKGTVYASDGAPSVTAFDAARAGPASCPASPAGTAPPSSPTASSSSPASWAPTASTPSTPPPAGSSGPSGTRTNKATPPARTGASAPTAPSSSPP